MLLKLYTHMTAVLTPHLVELPLLMISVQKDYQILKRSEVANDPSSGLRKNMFLRNVSGVGIAY
jgi:hypothetical protein